MRSWLCVQNSSGIMSLLCYLLIQALCKLWETVAIDVSWWSVAHYGFHVHAYPSSMYAFLLSFSLMTSITAISYSLREIQFGIRYFYDQHLLSTSNTFMQLSPLPLQSWCSVLLPLFLPFFFFLALEFLLCDKHTLAANHVTLEPSYPSSVPLCSYWHA